MSAKQTEDGIQPLPGVVFPVAPESVERHWPTIERMLVPSENWSQCFSSADVRSGLAKSELQLWTVLDQGGRVAIGLSRIGPNARGSVCTFWVVAPESDDKTINTLVDEAETFARLHSCSVLEVVAHPWLAGRVPGKVTAVMIERDCRQPRRTN